MSVWTRGTLTSRDIPCEFRSQRLADLFEEVLSDFRHVDREVILSRLRGVEDIDLYQYTDQPPVPVLVNLPSSPLGRSPLFGFEVWLNGRFLESLDDDAVKDALRRAITPPDIARQEREP